MAYGLWQKPGVQAPVTLAGKGGNVTGREARQKLQGKAEELEEIRGEIYQLMDQMRGSFQGIGQENVANAGNQAAAQCGRIAGTLRRLNTSFLDKNIPGGGGAW